MSATRVRKLLLGLAVVLATAGCGGGDDGNVTVDPNERAYEFQDVTGAGIDQADVTVVYRKQLRQVTNQSITLSSSDSRFNNSAGSIQSATDTVVNFTVADTASVSWTGVLTMASDGRTAALSLTSSLGTVTATNGTLASPFRGHYHGTWTWRDAGDSGQGTGTLLLDSAGTGTATFSDAGGVVASGTVQLPSSGVVQVQVTDVDGVVWTIRGNFTLNLETGGSVGSGTWSATDGSSGEWTFTRERV